MSVLLHDPDNDLDYTVDWSDYLTSLGDGVEISSLVWAILPTGPTLTGESNDTTTATVNVTGVARGDVHRLTCTMTPSSGQPSDQSVIIRGGPK